MTATRVEAKVLPIALDALALMLTVFRGRWWRAVLPHRWRADAVA